MAKTIMYIDGQNFMHRAKEQLVRAGLIKEDSKLTKLDLVYISNKLFPTEEIEIRYYGVAKVKRETEYGEEVLEKSVRVADEIRRLRGYLDQIGVVYRPTGRLRMRDLEPCKNCGCVDCKYTEKGVDVGLAAEMVQDAIEKRADKVILVSSDTDLIPAAKIAAQYAEIDYVDFEGWSIRGFLNIAKDHKIITGEILGMAYAEALAKKY